MSRSSNTEIFTRANADRIEAVLLRRRSGAAGPHGSRNTRRARTRSAARAAALRAEGYQEGSAR